MDRKELKATSPSGNADYLYYLKSEADCVMDGYELQHKADVLLIEAGRKNVEQMKQRITELEKHIEDDGSYKNAYEKTNELMDDEMENNRELTEKVKYLESQRKTAFDLIDDLCKRIKEFEVTVIKA